MSLIGLIVVIVVLALVFYLLQMLPIGQPFKNVILVLVIIVAILYLLSAAGLVSGLHLR